MQETWIGQLGEKDPLEGGGSCKLLQYSCLANPMDRGAWQVTIHAVTKSWTWRVTEPMHTHTHTHTRVHTEQPSYKRSRHSLYSVLILTCSHHSLPYFRSLVRTVSACVHAQLPRSCLTVRSHGLQPARLICPWNSPGKNTGVGCCAVLQGVLSI